MNTKISLMNLVNRIKFDEKMIKLHPEREEMLKKHMEKQKEYLIQCVMNNANNQILKQIMI